ncbi:MAG TPA: ABC transporter ATP-binding protein [Stellaceae bacterium]|nr:ABC transporter ATP-binding protein [Stellaceae bacterium]
MTALLEIEELSVDIPLEAGTLHAVRDVSLGVDRGETLCVVGESGSGKSLTALSVMGLLPRRAIRRARRLVLLGEDIAAASERRMSELRGDRMAMVFQEPMTALNPAYTIGNQMTETLTRHRRLSARAARDRVAELLDRVGIPAAGERLSQYPHQLSGGLRQRVMIAMMLLCDPDLLIADEPTTALDVTLQAQILALLVKLQRELGLGLLLITHDLGVVARVAQRVAVMYAGEIVETGSVEAIFARPRHPYTQGLLACVPVPGKITPGAPLGTIPGMVPSLIGETVGCAFRDRCPVAFDACARRHPLPVALDLTQTARCLRLDADAA